MTSSLYGGEQMTTVRWRQHENEGLYGRPKGLYGMEGGSWRENWPYSKLACSTMNNECSTEL